MDGSRISLDTDMDTDERLTAGRGDGVSLARKKGLQELLNFYVSEHSEIVVSISSFFILGGLYIGPNSEFTYVTRGATTEDLVRTLRFLTLDIVLEFFLFIVLCFFIKLVHKIDVIALGRAYFRIMYYRVSAISCFIVFVVLNISFSFNKHAGLGIL